MTLVSRSILPLSAIVAVSAAFSTQAFANHDTTYVSIEHAAFSVANSRTNTTEHEPTGVRIKIGTSLSYAFDIEAQMAATSDDSAKALDQFDTSLAGVYLKGYLPLGFRSSVYGVGGYSWTKFTAISGDQEFVNRQSGFSYGFGVETRLTDNIDLSADFMNYSQEDAEYDEVVSVNFGIKLYF